MLLTCSGKLSRIRQLKPLNCTTHSSRNCWIMNAEDFLPNRQPPPDSKSGGGIFAYSGLSLSNGLEIP